MGMFRKLLMVAAMQSQQGETGDMTEVYAYAQSVGITPQQVDAALADKPAIIKGETDSVEVSPTLPCGHRLHTVVTR